MGYENVSKSRFRSTKVPQYSLITVVLPNAVTVKKHLPLLLVIYCGCQCYDSMFPVTEKYKPKNSIKCNSNILYEIDETKFNASLFLGESTI